MKKDINKITVNKEIKPNIERYKYEVAQELGLQNRKMKGEKGKQNKS